MNKLEVVIDGDTKNVFYEDYFLEIERPPYELEITRLIDNEGDLIETSNPIIDNPVLSAIVEFIRSPDQTDLVKDHKAIFCDKPNPGQVARSVSFYCQSDGYTYTVSGLGLIQPTDNSDVFKVTSPDLTISYSEYQDEKNTGLGGTTWFTEEGSYQEKNATALGVFEYSTGLYSVLRKIKETKSFGENGLNVPEFVLAGRITNLFGGKYGFYSYRVKMAPDYMANRHLYLLNSGDFSDLFFRYIKSKYKQLFHLHTNLKQTHGQFSITNTMIDIDTFGNIEPVALIKDFDTNRPIPNNERRIIKDGICSEPTGLYVNKSPKAASQIYDLHLALLQDLFILQPLANQIEDQQKKFEYLGQQSARLLLFISENYPLVAMDEAKEAIFFAMQTYHASTNLGVGVMRYNYVMAGAFAHRYFSLSSSYSNQIEITKKL